jgi:Ca2+-binding EF-hand superfamily protein
MFHRFAALLMFAVLCLTLCEATALAQAVQVQAAPNQTEIRKKLIDATKMLTEALRAVSKAEAAKVEAEGDEAKQAAAQEVEKVRAKAETLRAEVAKLNRQLLDAATAQAVVVRGSRGGVATQERENADPQDPYERFALLTPGGPVVVQVALTVNGQPFRTVREKLIDDMLVAADKDKDGKATWIEALSSSRFTLGRVRFGNDEQKQSYVRTLDKNGDGIVDRPEVRLFVAQSYGAPAFALGAGYGGGYGAVFVANGRMIAGGGTAADVRALLDTDADGALSDKEIAAAAERLKTRDADDNDLLYPEEISGQAATARRVNATGFSGQPQTTQASVLLGPVATADGLFAALSQSYKNADGNIMADSFSALPELFETLDKDDSGNIEKEEVLGLNEVHPHVELTVDLGRDAKGLALKSTAAELTKVSESAESSVLELPGVRLSLVANRQAPQTFNYQQNAKAYLIQFDKDNNGYLEKSELPENVAQQLFMWDENEDGKVYLEEISASFARQVAPQNSQVVASAASQGNSLFQALDQTGDGRLSLREMRVASTQILALDKDDDKQLSLREIPATFSVTFGLGNAGNQYRVVSVGGAPGAPAPAAAGNGPEWFTRMDRNGDGDVTLKEFLGDETEFKQLDTNADGFIEAKEAAAVEAAK